MIERMTPRQRSEKMQQSHVLLLFSNAARGKNDEFLQWYTSQALNSLCACDHLLSVRQYALYPLKLAEAYKPLGFNYLSFCRLCLDGAEESAGLIQQIHSIFEKQPVCGDIAIWLYYPVGEKVGLQDAQSPYMTIAFSNPIPGCENQFREWYVTQHVRHALMIPALENGQVFEATQFQMCLSLASEHTTIAVYEMGASPEQLLESIPQINKKKMAWSPAGDLERFTECFFKLI